MTPGAWYPATGNPGVYVSILQPNLIDPAILQSYKTTVNNLDSVEASALCYLIAFDLDQFELGYALGTEHPRVEWSDHMLAQMRESNLARARWHRKHQPPDCDRSCQSGRCP